VDKNGERTKRKKEVDTPNLVKPSLFSKFIKNKIKNIFEKNRILPQYRKGKIDDRFIE